MAARQFRSHHSRRTQGIWTIAGVADLLVGSVGFGGLFAVYTYVALIVTERAGLSASVVPWILVVIGLGMTVGNLVGGRYAEISVSQAMFVLAFTAQTVFGLLTGLFFVGLASAAVAPTIQTRLMDIAKESQSIAAATQPLRTQHRQQPRRLPG